MMRRLGDEHGMALPMALGVMLVLSITVFAVIGFSSANTRNSSLNERRQSAKALAEAGVSHGASVVAQRGAAVTTNTAGTATIQGVAVPWTATYAAPIWTVRATASLGNPTGPGTANVSRTVEAQFKWEASAEPPLWHGLYIGNPGSRLFMSNAEASIATDVYARGNVTMTQGKFLGSSFQVWGSLTLPPGCAASSTLCYDASIGASDRINCGSDYRSFKSNFPQPCSRSTHRVTTFKVKDGCRFPGDGFSGANTFSQANCNRTSEMGGPSGKIWLTCPTCPSTAPAGATIGGSSSVVSTAFSDMPDDIQLSAPDLPATWNLGPGKPCVNPTNAPSFASGAEPDIMGSSSYTCISTDGLGELSWNASTNVLTAKGVIYFPSKLKLQSGRWGLVAPGDGRIHVGSPTSGGKLTLTNNTGLCGLRHATTTPMCDPAWDPLAAGNLVSFIVHSNESEAILQDNFHFQGGLYTSHTNGGYLVQNVSSFKGPTTFEGGVQLQNNGTIDAWSPSSSSSSPTGPAELVFVRGSWRG